VSEQNLIYTCLAMHRCFETIFSVNNAILLTLVHRHNKCKQCSTGTIDPKQTNFIYRMVHVHAG